ncbi:MFS transporter [Bifidobacterium olomucense]|uniref:Permease n=1 Tax=Bifidobacterium olomucense TaxID=2675324 RepID=A0A7Y0EZN9_9BIFI|nr:MFS transporter [Bifidobacterium sp. DSM 109959]NMM99352.1 permease [Bifidobacterium sp. DSM 109959]
MTRTESEPASEETISIPKTQWITYGVLVAMNALTIFDVSKLGVAFDSIQRSTGGNGVIVQLMLVGYTLAYASALLPAGRIGDLIGRRPVFLVGCSLFLLSSFICAMSPNAYWLVAGRFAQGIGAGVLMPQTLGLIQRIFPPELRAKPLAMMGACTSAVSLFGPVVAGVVMQVAGGNESWRWLFWIDVVVGVIVVGMAYALVKEPASEKKSGLDVVGIVLLIPAVIFGVGPISLISEGDISSFRVLPVILIGMVFACLFIVREHRIAACDHEPILDLTMFKFKHLGRGVLVSGFMHATATGGTLLITISLEQYAYLNELATALVMLPASVAMLYGASLVARRQQNRAYAFIVWGNILGGVSFIAVSVAFGVASAQMLPFILGTILIVISFGSAISASPNQARALIAVPDYRASVAGSSIQFAQRVGSAIGMGLVLVVYYGFGHSVVPVGGQPALGPCLAAIVVGVFLLCAAAIAQGDHD